MQNYTQTTNAATAAKTAWAPGIWMSEPDAATWLDDETGLQCAANRSATTGALSCQIGFTSSQAPLYNLAANSMPCVTPTNHIAASMDGNNVWQFVVYFDTAGDGQPATNYMPDQYRTWQHVLDHCTRMARELAAALGGAMPDEGLPTTGNAAGASDEQDTP